VTPTEDSQQRRPGRRRLLLTVAAAAIAFAAASALVGSLVSDDEVSSDKVDNYIAGKTQRPYVAADAQFRATFPRLPKRESQTVNVRDVQLPLVTYTAESGDTSFFVGAYDLGPEAPFDLNAALNGAAANIDGSVKSAATETFAGTDALHGVITLKDDAATVELLVFRTRERAYLIEVVGDSEAQVAKAFTEFKSSFALLT